MIKTEAKVSKIKNKQKNLRKRSKNTKEKNTWKLKLATSKETATTKQNMT